MNQATEAWIQTFAVEYAVSNRVAFGMTIPYLKVSFENEGRTTRDQGFAEPSLRARFSTPARMLSEQAEFTIGIGASLPIGEGVSNPISSDRNFVSNTIDPLLNAVLLFTPAPGWQWTVSASGRPVFYEDSDGKRAGSLFSGSMRASRDIAGALHASLAMNVVARGRDRLQGEVFDPSGGVWMHAEPRVDWTIARRARQVWNLWGSAFLPVYQNVNGTQLLDNVGGWVGLSFQTNLLAAE
jgi:hypothetical protein